jgi:toxin ParE1/3/4
MRVDLSAPAENDLFEIGLFIASDNLERALAFMDELETACLKLAEHPKRFPVIRLRSGFEIRRCVHRDYLILYRIDSERIVVLRIIDGAMDYESLLDRDEE